MVGASGALQPTVAHTMAEPPRKPLYWCRSSKRDYDALPEEVQDDAGFQLDLVQQGLRPLTATPERAVGGGVMKLVVNERGDTFRVFYLARFEEAVYVLHAFQKKSSSGKATPKRHLDTVRRRLKEVEQDRPARS